MINRHKKLSASKFGLIYGITLYISSFTAPYTLLSIIYGHQPAGYELMGQVLILPLTILVIWVIGGFVLGLMNYPKPYLHSYFGGFIITLLSLVPIIVTLWSLTFEISVINAVLLIVFVIWSGIAGKYTFKMLEKRTNPRLKLKTRQ